MFVFRNSALRMELSEDWALIQMGFYRMVFKIRKSDVWFGDALFHHFFIAVYGESSCFLEVRVVGGGDGAGYSCLWFLRQKMVQHFFFLFSPPLNLKI